MRIFLFLICFNIFFSSLSAQIHINEILTSNISGIVDEDNEYSDWIELYNEGNTAVNLSGYSLSDDKMIPGKWTFPAVDFAPNSFLIVFASGKDRKDLPLSAEPIISYGDEWQYLVPSTEPNISWRQSNFTANGWLTGISGFGYGDDDDATLVPNGTLSVYARKEFEITDISSLQALALLIDYDDGFVAYINNYEIARSNLGEAGVSIPYNAGTDGQIHEANLYQGGKLETFLLTNIYDYLIEGTNVLAIQVHNSDAASTDLTLIPLLYKLVQNNGVVGSTQYSYSDINLHTNFKINSDGESVFLFGQGNSLIDSMPAIALNKDVSFGRQPDGNSEFYFFGQPTPSAENASLGVNEIYSDSVIFSKTGGYYKFGLNLSLTSISGTSPIYFTTNGSIPNISDNLYTTPVSILQNTIVRARAIPLEGLPGPIISNTYYTDFKHDLPVVCLSTDNANLWDENTGILAYGPNPGEYPYFGANFWQDWEKPISIEYYNINGIKILNQDAGVKIFGNWSRANEQKSMAFYARKEYGKGSFSYPLFSTKNIDKFESFVLRNSGNDYDGLRFQDVFLTGLTQGMKLDYQAAQPSVVYINGQYWGILNTREKVNENFLADNHHVNPDSVNLLQLNSEILAGTNEGYNEILNTLQTYTTLVNDENYMAVAKKIDIDNYIRYQLTQIYYNNTDWPGNNIKFWNTTAPESKWRWILFDTDFGFGLWELNDVDDNTLSFALAPSNNSWPNPAWSTLLFRRMVTNISFRNQFIIQYCDRINTNFLPTEINRHIDSLSALYQTEMQHHFDRWSGNMDNWNAQIANRKTFGANRPEYARQHMKSVFKLGNEQIINVQVSDVLAGRVKVNSVVPKTFPFSGIYFQNIPIRLTALPKPGYKFVRWEGQMVSTENSINYGMATGGTFKAIFAEAGAADISVVFNEINFNSSTEKDTKDWLEVYNSGNTAVDLKGWILSDSDADSGWVFPSPYLLEQNAYLVICKDLEAFKTIHSNVENAMGDINFGLGSNGDELRLYTPDKVLMDAVDYLPSSPWPESANGTGSTLELVDPWSDNSTPDNWKISPIAGTPGIRNSVSVIVSIKPTELETGKLNEISGFPNPFTDYTSISFTVADEGKYILETIDISGKTIKLLSDSYLYPNTYYIDWLGEDQWGQKVPAGVYSLRLTSSKSVTNFKIVKL